MRIEKSIRRISFVRPFSCSHQYAYIWIQTGTCGKLALVWTLPYLLECGDFRPISTDHLCQQMMAIVIDVGLSILHAVHLKGYYQSLVDTQKNKNPQCANTGKRILSNEPGKPLTSTHGQRARTFKKRYIFFRINTRTFYFSGLRLLYHHLWDFLKNTTTCGIS